MARVRIRSVNAAWDHLEVEPDVAMELSDHFSYELPGAQHSPAFKKGRWDGKKRIFDMRRRLMPAGLRDAVGKFCERRGYELAEVDPRAGRTYTSDDASLLLDVIRVPARFDRREHQLRTVASALTNGRRLFLSPTSSGKSLAIYAVARYHGERGRTLVVVPTVGLLKQLPSDFAEYGCRPELVHVATTKQPDPPRSARIVVSTWQTAVRQGQEWHDQFTCVCGDEAHLFKADSLQEIMGRLVNAHHRFGFTGTLDGSKTNEMVLRGAFGPVEKIITTMELVELGYVARPSVHVVRLVHPQHAAAEVADRAKQIRCAARREGKPAGGAAYAAEIEYLAASGPRNRFIARLVAGLPGATLVLFHREEHGLALTEAVRLATDRPAHFINGGVGGLEREEIRQLVIASTGAPVLLASTGTSATGINIPNIRNVVFASPWKSRIINLQSIGRGLRLDEGKDGCGVYDVTDDLSWRGEANYTLKHLEDRVRIYAEEGFEYRTYPVDLAY